MEPCWLVSPGCWRMASAPGPWSPTSWCTGPCQVSSSTLSLDSDNIALCLLLGLAELSQQSVINKLSRRSDKDADRTNYNLKTVMSQCPVSQILWTVSEIRIRMNSHHVFSGLSLHPPRGLGGPCARGLVQMAGQAAARWEERALLRWGVSRGRSVIKTWS